MKKNFFTRLITTLLGVVLMFSVVACSNADKTDGTKGLKYRINSDGESYSVIGIGDATVSDIVIPTKHDGKPVTHIGGDAFKDSTITSVMMQDGLKIISSRAFMNCKSLKKVTISESVIDVGNQCFFNTPLLEEFVFNAINCKDSSVHNGMFYNSGSNTSGLKVYIGEKVESIPNYMFVPENVSDDGTAPSIVEINFSANGNLLKIGLNAFRNLSGVTKLNIPQSVVEIGDFAFSGCENVSELIFATNSKLERIGKTAFSNFLSLKKVYFPSGLKTIDADAFYVDSGRVGSLESVYIPSSVTFVGAAAFYKNPRTNTTVTAYLQAQEVPLEWDQSWKNFGVQVVVGASVEQLG